MPLFKVVDIATHNVDSVTNARTPLLTKKSNTPYKRVTFEPMLPAEFADMKMSEIASLPKKIQDAIDQWQSSATEQKVRNIFDFDGLDSLVLGKSITAVEQEYLTDAPYTFVGNDGNTVSTSKITVFAIGNENPVSVANRRLAENGVTVVVDGVVTTYTKREKAPIKSGENLSPATDAAAAAAALEAEAEAELEAEAAAELAAAKAATKAKLKAEKAAAAAVTP